MIEEIKINGVLYKLKTSVFGSTDYCTVCDLFNFCNHNTINGNNFAHLCRENNKNNSYYKKQ